jgi:hypothetical protein
MKGSFVHIVELKMSRTGDTSDFDGHDFYDFACSSQNAPFCDGFSTTILDIGQRISIFVRTYLALSFLQEKQPTRNWADFLIKITKNFC